MSVKVGDYVRWVPNMKFGTTDRLFRVVRVGEFEGRPVVVVETRFKGRPVEMQDSLHMFVKDSGSTR